MRTQVSATLLTVLLAGGGGRRAPAFDIGVTTSLDRVFADRPVSFRGTRTRDARVELARNEYEAVQVVVFPNRDLRRFTAAVGDLRHAGGGSSLPRADVAITLIGSVNLVQPRLAGSQAGWYPDPLLPNDPVELSRGALQSYLITVHTRAETQPGDFTGTLHLHGVTDDGAAVADSVTLHVHVWNFALPKTPHLKTMALCGWDLPGKMWPSDRFTNEQATAIMLRVADLGYRNRLPPSGCLANGLVSWNWKGKGNTDYGFPTHDGAQFNAARTGALIDYMLDHGANNIFIGFTANPYALPAQSAQRETRLRRYLTDYRAYLQSRKLLPLAYVYGIDEPWGAAVADAKRVYRVVKDVAPDVAFMQNTNQNNDRAVATFLGSFDALDINLGWFDTLRVDRARRQSPAALRDLWWNINAWPESHPNLFLEDPLTDARIVGPMSYKFSIQGFEYWNLLSKSGVHSYHPIARGETRVKWDVGRESLDGTLMYPAAADREVYSSLRFESLRDGFEDAEYLYLLAAKDPKNPLLSVGIVSSISTFATEPDSILAFRRKVARALEGSP